MTTLIPAETCGKPLQRDFREQRAVHAVVSAVRAALARYAGPLTDPALTEAYSHGVARGMSFLPSCGRRLDHDGECDQFAHRGVDYDCEECGKRVGFFLRDGWRRCKDCGYPSK